MKRILYSIFLIATYLFGLWLLYGALILILIWPEEISWAYFLLWLFLFPGAIVAHDIMLLRANKQRNLPHGIVNALFWIDMTYLGIASAMLFLLFFGSSSVPVLSLMITGCSLAFLVANRAVICHYKKG